MTIDLLRDKGTALDQQRLSWRDMVGKPISKLDDDAFTRVRVILMNGLELDSLRTKQVALRMNRDARVMLAQLMRVEQHQATTINWLLGADHSPIEATIGYEQTAIEVTASVAQLEPDPYLAQGYRYALLEDFDHLYRYSALLDRLEGKDANNITQGYTDIVPGRPTIVHHRAPEHDLLEPYEKGAKLATKLHALTLTGGEYQTHDYYMNIGPIFADPLARQLYAEIASVESQHITHYGSMLNPVRSVELRGLPCSGDESARQGNLGTVPRLRARAFPGGAAALQGHRAARSARGARRWQVAGLHPVQESARVRSQDRGS
jgi:hypothetical protein